VAIAVIDYCKGNLSSVQRWLVSAGLDAFVTDDPERIMEADALVLPGVGAFRDAADHMEATGQMQAIRTQVMQRGVPFLGICLGLQLLMGRGDEGCAPGTHARGIGAVDGWCVRMVDTTADGRRLKIPHVGWNSIEMEGCAESPLLAGVPEGSFFYFTHSYRVVLVDSADVTSYTTYADRFPSSLHHGNIYGTQFHPEKSSDAGLVVARNFGRIIYG